MTSSRDHMSAAPSSALVHPSASESQVRSVHVQTKTGTFSFSCHEDESLLSAGLSAGYDLPYECSTGTCGSSHARVASGAVDACWPEAPGLAKLAPSRGDVLMCQARPRTDCAILVRTSLVQPAQPAPRVLRRVGRVIGSNRLTTDVMRFEVELSSPMDFEAGQFVGLRHPGVEGARAYSMINHCSSAGRLGFVVKRKPGGRLSDEIFDGAFLGLDIDVLGPFGRATFRPTEQRDFVCIAGGSGIAGMMAILAHAQASGHFKARAAHVFFGVRSRDDAFFVARFADLVRASEGRLNVVLAFSHAQEVPAVHPDFPCIGMAKGFVHEVAAAAMNERWTDEIGFVAGPQPMVDAAIRMLITEAGIKPSDIRFDKFS